MNGNMLLSESSIRQLRIFFFFFFTKSQTQRQRNHGINKKLLTVIDVREEGDCIAFLSCQIQEEAKTAGEMWSRIPIMSILKLCSKILHFPINTVYFQNSSSMWTHVITSYKISALLWLQKRKKKKGNAFSTDEEGMQREAHSTHLEHQEGTNDCNLHNF